MAITNLLENFLFMALVGGLGVALVAGPLGAIIVWRRMAYFGETLAHAGLLGISLSFLWSLPMQWSVMGVCMLIAVILSTLQKEKNLTTDTWLGILAHSSLAIGLVVMTYLQGVRVDLFGYLFGDILALDYQDLLWIYIGGTIALCGLAYIWRPLIAWIVDEELAQVEAVSVYQVRTFLMVIIALVIAIAMKIVGVLLIAALMIIPAATARQFARTPESMALWSSLFAGLAVCIGLALSFWLDIPAGPAIVVAALSTFIISYPLFSFAQR